MLRPQDFDHLRQQAATAAETGGTVFEADPAVILALLERYDAETTTAEEGVEIVADLRTQLAIATGALRAACDDGWADGEGAMNGYLLRAAIAADQDLDEATSPGDANTTGEGEGEDLEGVIEHGWRLRQDEGLPEGAVDVIEHLAAVAADCGAGTAHAAGLRDDDRAISTYGVLLDEGLTVGVAVDCETGVIRWASRPTGRK